MNNEKVPTESSQQTAGCPSKQDHSWAGKSVIEDIREAATIAAFEYCLEEWKEDHTF
ncbi:MAG: hypothetical protein JXA22_10005 [Candidatus Thermoplasmatota archaeon]|nr:hypothetical protein [Candidatus Thermoplasmatota archaeon]